MKWQIFRNSINRSWKIIVSPAQEWDAILLKNPQNRGWHMRHFVLPLIVLILLSNFVGYLFLALTIKKYSITYVTAKTLLTFFDSFFTFYAGTFIINKIIKRLQIQVNYSQIFILLSYSLSIFWLGKIIAGLLANYPTLGSFFVFLGISGIYPFIVGAEKMKITETKTVNKLVFTSFSVIILLYILIRWISGLLLQYIHYHQL
jgi:hypothetical protein